jgi:hypothetical protein
VIGGDLARIDAPAAEELQFIAGNAIGLRWQAVGMHGEMGPVHLIQQRADGIPFGSVRKQADAAPLLIDGMEKWKSVYVVPVRVRKNDVNLLRVVGKIFAQFTDSGTRIQNKRLVSGEVNADAGGIASIAKRR